MALSEEHRQKLDGIVSRMQAAGESDDAIRFVVGDFKQKYGASSQPGFGESLGLVGKGIAKGGLGPIATIASQLVQHPIDTPLKLVKGALVGDPEQRALLRRDLSAATGLDFQGAQQDPGLSKYSPEEQAAIRGLSEFQSGEIGGPKREADVPLAVPLIEPLMAAVYASTREPTGRAVEAAGRGDTREVLSNSGEALGALALSLLPKVRGVASPATKAVAGKAADAVTSRVGPRAGKVAKLLESPKARRALSGPAGRAVMSAAGYGGGGFFGGMLAPVIGPGLAKLGTSGISKALRAIEALNKGKKPPATAVKALEDLVVTIDEAGPAPTLRAPGQPSAASRAAEAVAPPEPAQVTAPIEAPKRTVVLPDGQRAMAGGRSGLAVSKTAPKLPPEIPGASLEDLLKLSQIVDAIKKRQAS